MKKFYFLIIFLTALPLTVLANDIGSLNLSSFKNILPAPFVELIDTFSKISPNPQAPLFRNLENTILGLKNESFNFSNPGIKFKEIFYKINHWFEINLGISLVAILKAIFNVIIWIFETLIKLIRLAISAL